MRRSLLTVVCLLAVPASVSAQPALLVGGGLTSPTGALGDQADSGYHARLGARVGIPTLPVAVRLDGSCHRMGEANATLEPTTVTAGALSVVFFLPGVALRPYVLGGVDRYRVKAGSLGASVTRYRNGFHAGFGVSLGALAFGGFAELRYTRIDTPTGDDLAYLPLTIGFRL